LSLRESKEEDRRGEDEIIREKERERERERERNVNTSRRYHMRVPL